MRVIHSIQVQKNFISYLEDEEPFAVAHDHKIAGCYFPSKSTVPVKGSGILFDQNGIYHRNYPDLSEGQLVLVLEGMRDSFADND